jgi:fructosamine-3-kinase
VGGGCISQGARIDTEAGSVFFLKWHAAAPEGLFEAEVDGLRALQSTSTLRVPEPIASGGMPGGPSWLVLEYVPTGTPAPDYDERLGRGLAAMHASAGVDDSAGWSRPNWIGSLPQPNDPCPTWSAFWRDRRLGPQLELARARGYLRRDGGTLDKLMASVEDALAGTEGGSAQLLHGDLWSGNAYAGPAGEPVLVDPAVYRGHGEVDLAMTELFGGFGPRFYAAYAEVAGIPPAYRAVRRDLYQLYYLLVHVNLFGRAYESRTRVAARSVLAALGA